MHVVKRGNKYYLDYYVQGRRIRMSFGDNKQKALDELAMRRAEVLQGRSHLPPGMDVTFGAFAGEYMEKYSRGRKRSWLRDETSLKKLIPAFGGFLLREIKPFLIEGYILKRRKTVRPATINRERSLLSNIFTKAIDEGKAAFNPVGKVKRLQEETPPMRLLTLEEIARLLAGCTPYFRPIVLTALHTGMRRGEILDLKWEQVDLGSGWITVLKSKSGKSRMIPISPVLGETLLALKRSKDSSGYVFISDKTKKPINACQTAWLGALKRSGLDHFRFHDLRHNFASHLIVSGVDIATVKELLGHSDVAMTMRYAHSAPDTKKQAVKTISELFGAPSGHKTVTVLDLSEKTISISH